MNIEQVVELFYEDYYLNDQSRSELNVFKKIRFDKLGFYIFSNINKVNEFTNLNEFIQYYSAKYFEKTFSLNSLSKIDYLEVEKKIGNISYPFYVNIDRLKILEKSISENIAITIFGISICDIYNITGLIILRILLYNDYILHQKTMTYERLKFFGKTEVDCFFTAQELQKLNSDITINKIRMYLDVFSIELDKISKVEDTKRIINMKGKYVVMYMKEFCTFVFNYCENCIIDYLRKIDKKLLQDYYDKRGSVFEKYVKNVVGIIYPNVLSKVKYVDNKSRKMEIDNLIIEDDICLNFECKSSGFNIYELSSSDDTLKKLRNAFGRGYFSIDTFHKTIENEGGIIELEIDNKKKIYNLKDKKIVSFNVTMYPIDFLSTSIHLFDEKSNKNISFFPVTINIMDLYSIILISIIDKNIFKQYSIERFYSINKIGKLKLDYDEIDAFGYLLDNNLKNGYQMIKNMEISHDCEQHIVISNAAYRDFINQKLAWFGFNVLANTLLSKNNVEVFKRMFSKRNFD